MDSIVISDSEVEIDLFRRPKSKEVNFRPRTASSDIPCEGWVSFKQIYLEVMGAFNKGALVQREAISQLSQLYIQEGMHIQASSSVYGLEGRRDKN
jgi:hypothetical protein